MLFDNLPQLVFGGHNEPGGGAATMHFPDLPLLATLLGANLRHGRNVAAFDDATRLQAYVESPPPAGTTPANPPRRPAGHADASTRSGSRSARRTCSPTTRSWSASRRASRSSSSSSTASGASLFTMSEEHQVTSGEYITPGAPRDLFNNICGGCHGSISGAELDIAVTADTLTGASVSVSRDLNPTLVSVEFTRALHARKLPETAGRPYFERAREVAHCPSRGAP